MASVQPIRIASCESAGTECATMPTTRSVVGVSPVAKLRVSPSRMFEPFASDRGTMTAPPASSAAKAVAESPPPSTKTRRPSAAKSAPEMAAASWRTPPSGTPRSPIGETDFTPGNAAISSIDGSVGEIEWIEVSSSLPGIVSVSQFAPIWRIFCAAVPRATTIARPMTSAPAVSVVRLTSRASELRASRSSLRNIRSGIPASQSSGPRTRGTIRTATSIRP